MSVNKHSNDALLFKAFSDEKRLAVIELLRAGEKCACVLTEETNIAQSALSYHMKILKDAGIVTCRNDGKYCHYSIHEEGSVAAINRLAAITKISQDAKQNCSSC